MTLIKTLLKNLARVTIGSIVFLLLIEVGIRIAYKVRNARVEYVPIPYMVRNFGLVPPWMEGLRIIEPDDVLLFRGRPNAQRKYLDLFCPMPSGEIEFGRVQKFGVLNR